MPKIGKGNPTITEMYTWYVSLHPNKHVDFKTYKATVIAWGLAATDLLLKGKDLPLYCGLGTLGVRKKYKPVFIDRRESVKQGKKVLGSNSHSEFWSAKLVWMRYRIRVPKEGWRFQVARRVDRATAVVLKTLGGHKRFVESMIFSGRPQDRKIKKHRL